MNMTDLVKLYCTCDNRLSYENHEGYLKVNGKGITFDDFLKRVCQYLHVRGFSNAEYFLSAMKTLPADSGFSVVFFRLAY